MKIKMIKQTMKTHALLLLMLIMGTACSQKLNQQTAASATMATANATENPVLKRNATNPVLRIEIDIPAGSADVNYKSLQGVLTAESLKAISKMEVYLTGATAALKKDSLVGSTVPTGKNFTIPLNASLKPGKHHLWLSVTIKDTADPDGLVAIKATQLKDEANKGYAISQNKVSANPIGFALRKPKDDGVASYRIPGVVTTDKGTLISVYDIRYNNSRRKNLVGHEKYHGHGCAA
jgi:sialidase-1